MKAVTLNVPQGIGDIFWIYQKVAPHVDVINFNIHQIWGAAVHPKLQTRAVEFLKLLPKTGVVGTKVVAQAEFVEGLVQRHKIETVLRLGEDPQDYSLNHILEEGVRLELVDPGFKVEFSVPVKTLPSPELTPGAPYFLFYMSGSFTHPKSWRIPHWIECIDRLYAKYGWTKESLPIVMIGADYDRGAMDLAFTQLSDRGYQTQGFVDGSAAVCCDIIKNAKFFFGFQSGLSILADNFDTPQLMMYVPEPDAWLAPKAYPHRLLMYSWPKLSNVMDSIYNPATFAYPPQQVVDRLSWRG